MIATQAQQQAIAQLKSRGYAAVAYGDDKVVVKDPVHTLIDGKAVITDSKLVTIATNRVGWFMAARS